MRIGTTLAGTIAAVMICCLVLLWDDRSLERKAVDAGGHPPELAAMVAARPGEILWIDGYEAWYWLGRPHWGLRIQGAGIVFSRPLAMLWEERIKTLIDLDLIDPNVLAPWTTPMGQQLIQLTRDKVDRFCARGDAPAWIVAPLEQGAELPKSLNAATWKPPVPQFKVTQDQGRVAWHRIETYAIVPCAGGGFQKGEAGSGPS
jgi:hypothetical protein